MRARIRKADSKASNIMIDAFRATFTQPRDPEAHSIDDAINQRMTDIAARQPEQPTLPDERATFRTLVHLALRQAVMILRIYESAMRFPEGPKTAHTLLEAFVGYAPVPIE